MVRHFTTLFELTEDETRGLMERALDWKRDHGARPPSNALAGRTLGLLFEKPSLRTRVSFEAAFAQLGGTSIFLPAKEVGLGDRESIADFARVLSQYVDALAARTFSQATVEELARHATIPIINALSDKSHPCQAMADLMTVREVLGHTEDVRIVFVGDGNNVARSLATACALLEARFRLCCPRDFAFPPDFQQEFSQRFPGITLEVTHDPIEGVVGADVIYTDVWSSMGQEEEAEARRSIFEPFRVNGTLMDRAGADTIFLHCLPAHRGEEVTADVLDGPRSFVIPQAANRLHFQKALLVWLLDQSSRVSGKPHAKSPLPRHSRRRRKTG